MSTFLRKPGYLNRTSATALIAAADADMMDRPHHVVYRARDASASLDERPAAAPTAASDTPHRPMSSAMALIIARLDDDKLYNTKELGRVLDGFVGARSLERYRCSTGKGGGPAYSRSGGGAFAKGKVVYLGLDVKNWLRAGYVPSWHDPEAIERERERRQKREARHNRR